MLERELFDRRELLDRMIYVSEAEATTPRQGKTCHVNRWWIVHPEKGLTFYQTTRSPQCNDDERGVRLWCERFPGHVVKQIPAVFI